MLLLGYCHIGCGQEQVLVDTLNVQVYFRQGYSILEFDYRDNAKRLAAFVDSVRTLQGSASCRVKTFRIVGTASPEGVSVLNKRLSENRAKNLVAWIEEYISLEGATLDIQALGIDWERLERQVVASDMPYRDEVLEILRNTPVWVIRDGKVVDSRNRQLGMLRGGIWRSISFLNCGVPVCVWSARWNVPHPLRSRNRRLNLSLSLSLNLNPNPNPNPNRS